MGRFERLRKTEQVQILTPKPVVVVRALHRVCIKSTHTPVYDSTIWGTRLSRQTPMTNTKCTRAHEAHANNLQCGELEFNFARIHRPDRSDEARRPGRNTAPLEPLDNLYFQGTKSTRTEDSYCQWLIYLKEVWNKIPAFGLVLGLPLGGRNRMKPAERV